MKRSDATKFKVQFRLKEGDGEAEAGLVCWHDRQLVYCLSNDSNNYEFDHCYRRGEGRIHHDNTTSYFDCTLQSVHGWSRFG
jgi:hypothetical protein